LLLTASDGANVPSAIYSSWPLAAQAGLHAKHLGREMQTESAQARSLDSVLSEYADRKVQLVKLDVDGFECDVLRGATSLLRDARPIFVMELRPTYSSSEAPRWTSFFPTSFRMAMFFTMSGHRNGCHRKRKSCGDWLPTAQA